jgi:hypothetical protein
MIDRKALKLMLADLKVALQVRQCKASAVCFCLYIFTAFYLKTSLIDRKALKLMLADLKVALQVGQ